MMNLQNNFEYNIIPEHYFLRNGYVSLGLVTVYRVVLYCYHFGVFC